MSILFVNGINDSSRIKVRIDEQGKFTYAFDGTCGVRERLHLQEDAADGVILFGDNVKQPGLRLPKRPKLIFNQISDPDTHVGALKKCVQLCRQARCPVINHPESIQKTSRDKVSQLLQGIPGIHVPKTVRFQPGSPDDVFSFAESENISFPYILRIAGDHGGISTTRVNSGEDYAALHIYPFDGRDFYLTEFVDYQDSDGLHHKQRIVVIGGEIILRHTLFNENWLINSSSRDYMIKKESWKDYLARAEKIETDLIPKLSPAIDEIGKRLGLDYFGIDCCIDADGGMLIFEANANMNILFNKFPELDPLLNKINASIINMLEHRSGEKVSKSSKS